MKRRKIKKRSREDKNNKGRRQEIIEIFLKKKNQNGNHSSRYKEKNKT